MEIKKQELNLLLDYTINETKNLTVFNHKALIKNPQSILIFRLLLKKSQRQFSKLLNMSQGSLWNMENKLQGLREKNSKKLASNLSIIFNDLNLKDSSLEEIFSTYDRFNENYKMTSARAKEIRSNVSPFNNAKKGIKSRSKDVPENEFELHISNLLRDNNIKFEIHSVLELNNKKIIVDFAIPSSKDPKVVVEVKQTATKRPKRIYDTMHYQAIVIDHRMRAIKKDFPETKTVAIMSSKNIPVKNVSPYIKAEFLDTDAYFIDHTLDIFIEYVKKQMI